VTLALDEPDALPVEGNLRGATMRTEMGTYHMRPFGQPCIEGFSAAVLRSRWRMPVKVPSPRRASTKSSPFSATISPQTKAARGVALGPRSLCPRLVFARAARACGESGGAGSSRRWPIILWRARQPRRDFLHRAWGAG